MVSSILNEYEWSLNKSIWPINTTQTNSTIPDQSVAQTVGAVEYTDCTPAEGQELFFDIETVLR